ncbi:hypothetical protein ABMA28_008030 [Loxostege sticticalis]|uniref:Uncharacterized protein n=1 Tax=Loxostege sticticalis TaxID=481309 RepID=A0ABD0SFS7_LOXSC
MNDARYFSLTHRIAEETQLLAEEKWIVEALNKIKTQRNCLQIERLQLESMKSQLRKPATKGVAVAKIPDSPKTFTLSMMQNMSAPKPTAPNTPNRKFLEAEAACNTEQLNLGVTHSVFNSTPSEQFVMEEDDEEEEEVEDCDDLLLDMNMFMNCTQKQ